MNHNSFALKILHSRVNVRSTPNLNVWKNLRKKWRGGRVGLPAGCQASLPGPAPLHYSGWL